MKITVCKPYCHSVEQISYPNAATRREVFHRLLDTLLVAASGMGIAAILLFMLAL